MISRLLAGSDFIESVFSFFQNAMASVNIDYLLLIALGIIAAVIIVGSFRVIFSYESVAMRRIRKVNKYLLKNNVVTDENLVEFHKQMKKLPRRIRDRWQLFMLERDGLPSRYLTTEYCVKRVLENSSTENVMKQTKMVTLVVCLLTFVLGLFCRLNEAGTVSMANIIYVVLYAAIIPAVVGIFGYVFSMILQARLTAVNRDFYDVFTVFVRNVDKATNTMPDYVDYELLFTRKEINDGIPILREYLEKRALEEQRLLEKAKREAVEHSPYNFDDLGVNGSQLIERAVHESEAFLINKMNLQNEIAEYEKQLSNAEKNMDDIEKEANKKLQAIKENLERLDKANAETTNRVEINYNRRQAKDEMDKKAAIEKDLEGALAKEQTAIDGFNVEIQRRKQDIENSREGVESALKSEYNTFATKVYDELSAKVTEENSNLVREYEAQIVQMKATIRQLTANLEQSNTMLQVKQLELDNVRNYGASAGTFVPPVQIQNFYPDQNAYNEQQGYDANAGAAEGANLFDQNAQQAGGQNWNQYYDENGNLIDNTQYYDENGNLIDYSQYYGNGTENVDASQYYDENGNLIDYSQYYDENGNYIYQDQNAAQPAEGQQAAAPAEQTAEQTSVEGQPNYDSAKEPEPTQKDAAGENTEGGGIDWSQFYDENGNMIEPEKKDEETKSEKPEDKDKKDDDNDSDDDKGGKTPDAEANDEVNAATDEAVAAANEAKEKAEQAKAEAEEAAEKAKAEAKEEAEKAKAEAAKAKEEAEKAAEQAKAEAKEAAEKAKAEAQEAVDKAKGETEDLKKIQEQIAEENQKLIQQQQELRQQIDETLQSIEKSNKKADKAKNIAKIKALIEKLKIQAKEAKASGSKEQVKQINASVAELVAAIANYNK